MVTGTVTVEDIVRHFENVERSGCLPFAELIDARQVEEPYLGGGDVRRAAEKVIALCRADKIGPRAVLVDNAVTYGLTRMFTTFILPYFHMDVFRDPSEAADWLATWSRPN